MVISARNTVHSVLFLILSFFNAAGLFILLGAEFLAMVLVVVYVGAVAVLFLFVVMMLNIEFQNLKKGFVRHKILMFAVGSVLLAEILFVAYHWQSLPGLGHQYTSVPYIGQKISNTHAIGMVLYTDYIFLFQLAGVVLLIAMIGAIVLTLTKRDGVRRQIVGDQVARTKESSLEIKKVEVGKGV